MLYPSKDCCDIGASLVLLQTTDTSLSFAWVYYEILHNLVEAITDLFRYP